MKRLIISVSLAAACSGVAFAQTTGGATGSSATPADQTQLRTRQDEGGTVREPNYNAAEPRNRRANGETTTTRRSRTRDADSSMSSDSSRSTDQTQLRTRQDEAGTVREPNYNAAEPRNRRANGETRSSRKSNMDSSSGMSGGGMSGGAAGGTSGGATSGSGGSMGGSTGAPSSNK